MDPFLLIWLAILPAMLLAVAFIRLLHALANGLAALAFTRKPVTVYVGMNEAGARYRLRLGLMEIRLGRHPVRWTRQAFCIPSEPLIPFSREIIIRMAGALLPFFVMAAALFFAFAAGGSGRIKLVLIFLTGASVFDVVMSLVPWPRRRGRPDSSWVEGGGRGLLQLWRWRKYSRLFLQGGDYLLDGRFAEAAVIYTGLLSAGMKPGRVYGLALYASVLAEDFSKARELVKAFTAEGLSMNARDFLYAGAACSGSRCFEEALGWYERAVAASPMDAYAWAAKGDMLNTLGRFTEAIPAFDEALRLNAAWAFPYSGRGLARIHARKGDSGPGLADLETALALDEREVSAYYYLGTYYLHQGAYPEALQLFETAELLGGIKSRLPEGTTGKGHP